MKKGEPSYRHPSKACNQCKQQKLRCSISADSPSRCARCKKYGLECKVENGFRRVNKRMRTESLTQENETLRQQLETTNILLEQRTNRYQMEQFNGQSIVTPMSAQLSTRSTSPQHGLDLDPRDVAGSQTETPIYTADQNTQATASDTLPRTISGVQLEAPEIDEIFAIYFSHYAQHLPYLDPDMTPNGYYEESPLLFWSIIGVGCRRYDRNPTLACSIADPILHLGWPPLHRVPAIIPAIQGLLLLSCFPLSTAFTFNDISYTLSGMAINLALQIGLHVPMHRHEFCKNKSGTTDDDIARRVRLWFYCLVVHQKAACGLGYPITVSPDRLKKQMDLRGLSGLVPQYLQLEMRLGSILSRINPLFSPTTFAMDEDPAKFAREMMSDVFEAQMDELEAERTMSNLEQLYLNIARLQLRAYYLQDCEESASLGVAKLAIVAASVIDGCDKADRESSIALYCPHYLYRMVALAAAVLLRVLKATRASHRKEGNEKYKPVFFRAITLLRKMSVEDNDGPSRMSHMLSRLWSSDKMFRQKATFKVRVQSRLSMSILHEMTWWYREEFGPEGKIYSSPDRGCQPHNNDMMQQPGSRARASYSGRLENRHKDQDSAVESSSGILGEVGPDTTNFLTPSYWNSHIDQNFEAILEEFPDSWPV